MENLEFKNYTNILEKLKEIQDESSTNNKIELIKQWHIESPNVSEKVLKYLFDKNIKTNLASKKINKFRPTIPYITTMSNLTENDLFELMEYLTTKSTGKDIDIKHVRYYIDNKYYGVDALFFEEFVCKELSLGIDLKTVNKAIPNLIDVIEPMLATNYANISDKLDHNLEYYITMKLDGNRILVDARNKPFKAFTRNGVIVDGLDDFLDHLELPIGYVYDGELLPSKTSGKISSEQYKEISSIMRTKGVKNKDLIRYNIFDITNLEDSPYSERRRLLDTIIDNKYQTIVNVLYKGPINKKVFDLLDIVTKEGNEGLMANLESGIYETVRSKSILKFKKFHDVDLRCIGLEKGTGRFKDTLGAILVDYKGNIVKVGSGFSDELRDYYFKNKKKIINKIIKVKYFEESMDKDGNLSLRFPVFIEVREDKDTVSYD